MRDYRFKSVAINLLVNLNHLGEMQDKPIYKQLALLFVISQNVPGRLNMQILYRESGDFEKVC